MKTFGFTGTNDFAEYLADTFDKLYAYPENNNDDYSEIVVVAKYDVIKDVLNSIIKNTNFKLVSCNDLNDSDWDGYDDAFVLTIDPDMDVWVQAAKYEGHEDYLNMSETDIVFVHGDVNSAFVKQNGDSGCIMHEFNIDEDAEYVDNKCDDDCDNYNCHNGNTTSLASYMINGKKVNKKTFEKELERAINNCNSWLDLLCPYFVENRLL